MLINISHYLHQTMGHLINNCRKLLITFVEKTNHVFISLLRKRAKMKDSEVWTKALTVR